MTCSHALKFFFCIASSAVGLIYRLSPFRMDVPAAPRPASHTSCGATRWFHGLCSSEAAAEGGKGNGKERQTPSLSPLPFVVARGNLGDLRLNVEVGPCVVGGWMEPEVDNMEI